MERAGCEKSSGPRDLGTSGAEDASFECSRGQGIPALMVRDTVFFFLLVENIFPVASVLLGGVHVPGHFLILHIRNSPVETPLWKTFSRVPLRFSQPVFPSGIGNQLGQAVPVRKCSVKKAERRNLVPLVSILEGRWLAAEGGDDTITDVRNSNRANFSYGVEVIKTRSPKHYGQFEVSRPGRLFSHTASKYGLRNTRS